jgi:uncharacterized membrane protein YfcA
MHRVVGTSLAIILLNAAGGFYKHSQLLAASSVQIPWKVIAVFAAIGIVGSVVGNVVARRLANAQLRRVFGVFLVGMCGYILWESLPQVL